MDKSRKQFNAVFYRWFDDTAGHSHSLLIAGKQDVMQAAKLPEVVDFSKSQPERTVSLCVLNMLYVPPGTAPYSSPVEVADEADMQRIRQIYQENGTLRFNPQFQLSGMDESRMTDGKLRYLPQEAWMTGKRQRFSMVVCGVEGDTRHESVLLLPGAVTMEQARFRPEVREFAAQHPEAPTVFSRSVVIYTPPGAEADAPVVDATMESIRTIRLFHPEAPHGAASSIFQHVEDEADILIDGDNPYYQDPEEETEAER